MEGSIIWGYKKFAELSAKELYEILRSRQEVFIVEQDCIYLDTDDKDQMAYHLAGYIGPDLAVYGRIVYPGVSYQEVSIGRVLTTKKYRNLGLGKQLMEELIKRVELKYGKVDIRISAQYYLLEFYKLFNFKDLGEQYLEDGIPHIEMLRKVSDK